ncbi:helix-turn-helix transcriptional regulator [Leptolyngbya sp. NK1-12]|uniref:Helix-turn-helix transcriptional regulator n=1 Tax=Leptolyngbya sp. NK1-12 TaxID=2547451 RepID=A0AA96WVS6_9CYAN|nr:helix-turn-helix transcriptional regulator [Leptolyngbya sp. NK1-12]WNZ24642.1 helix-turn-helix transcriptional regulator [Leptolyngbya sp. NK1-12]
MGRAGQALKRILEKYGISQNSLAVALGVERGSVYRWVHEVRDPNAETVVEIVTALRDINPSAAEAFVQLYLGDVARGKLDPDNDKQEGRTD